MLQLDCGRQQLLGKNGQRNHTLQKRLPLSLCLPNDLPDHQLAVSPLVLRACLVQPGRQPGQDVFIVRAAELA